MEILSEIRNRIAFITLNRPAALNALSLNMVIRLRALLDGYAADSGVYAICIGGAGEKAFCAGGDIRALYASIKDADLLSHQFFVNEYSLDYLLYSFPKPYVVLMDRIIMGGGMGIAQSARLRIVSERSRIAMPEVAIGFFPDVGGSFFLSRMPGSLGIYLGLTAVEINGVDAIYGQLADIYLPINAIDSLQNDLTALQWTDDRIADLQSFINARAEHHLPTSALSTLRAGIDTHFSHSSVREILASLETERRNEYADWAQQTIKRMRSHSPTMLNVTLRQLQQGKNMNLADCFRMELTMTRRCVEHGDFLEGVRALLIDKDNSPHWQPNRFEEVTQELVDTFFHSQWTSTAHPLAPLGNG